MRIVAAVFAVIGIALAAFGYVSAREYSRYTVAAEGVVSQRTPTFCAVRIEGELPGGRASVEVQYSLLSGTGSDAPPESDPRFELGKRVAVVHPPGQPAKARLKDSSEPGIPLWVMWAGVALSGVGILLLLLPTGRPRAAARP